MSNPKFIFPLLIFLSLLGCNSPNQGRITQTVKGGDPYTWDFGEVKQGEVLKAIFILKNKSQRTLNIKDVNTTCGCTVSSVDKKVLLPAESASIEVQFNTQGYSGLVQQYIYVNTDDPDNPLLRLKVLAKVANLPVGRQGSN